MIFKHVFATIGGIIFGIGLSISGMINPNKVLDFLLFIDLGLLIVLGFAILITLISYFLIPKILNQPILNTSFNFKKGIINRKLIIGSILFGIGWGVSGVCPGTSLAGIGSGNTQLLYSIISIFFGAYIHGAIIEK